MEREQEFQVKGSRWAEEIPQRWRQPKGEDRTEVKKEAKLLSYTLLNGSAWSTERKYMRRYTGKCDIFFRIEHRLRKDGDLQRTQRESQMKQQAVRIVSTRRVGSLLQWIGIWEQLSEKKEQWHQSQATMVELPKRG